MLKEEVPCRLSDVVNENLGFIKGTLGLIRDVLCSEDPELDPATIRVIDETRKKLDILGMVSKELGRRLGVGTWRPEGTEATNG